MKGLVFIDIETLRELITAQVHKETDADLLDFIYKLLLQEGGNDALDAGIVLCG